MIDRIAQPAPPAPVSSSEGTQGEGSSEFASLIGALMSGSHGAVAIGSVREQASEDGSQPDDRQDHDSEPATAPPLTAGADIIRISHRVSPATPAIHPVGTTPTAPTIPTAVDPTSPLDGAPRPGDVPLPGSDADESPGRTGTSSAVLPEPPTEPTSGTEQVATRAAPIPPAAPVAATPPVPTGVQSLARVSRPAVDAPGTTEPAQPPGPQAATTPADPPTPDARPIDATGDTPVRPEAPAPASSPETGQPTPAIGTTTDAVVPTATAAADPVTTTVPDRIPSTILQRVEEAIRRLETAPPPRSVTIDLDDTGTARLTITLLPSGIDIRSDTADARFLSTVERALESRGFEMASDGRSDRGQPQQHERDGWRPTTPAPRRPSTPTSAGIRL